MKKALLIILIQSGVILLIYSLLLRLLAGTNIIAGCFCPGPHLPPYAPVLIALFLLCRIYVVLLPGFILSRAGIAWLRRKKKQQF